MPSLVWNFQAPVASGKPEVAEKAPAAYGDKRSTPAAPLLVPARKRGRANPPSDPPSDFTPAPEPFTYDLGTRGHTRSSPLDLVSVSSIVAPFPS